MRDTPPSPAPADQPDRRAMRRAVLRALPVIGLMMITLWSFVSALVLSVGLLTGLEIIGMVVVGALLVPPALWANWHAVRLAIEGELHHAE
jgi:hypothetical protein